MPRGAKTVTLRVEAALVERCVAAHPQMKPALAVAAVLRLALDQPDPLPILRKFAGPRGTPPYAEPPPTSQPAGKTDPPSAVVTSPVRPADQLLREPAAGETVWPARERTPPAESLAAQTARLAALHPPMARVDPASVYDVDAPDLEPAPAREPTYHPGDLLDLGGQSPAPGSLVKKPKAPRR